ncbi:MAG: hypothetical protein PUF37_01045 [Prevotellaceae bacterium]|nr:hypothetical protein [Prevotellaceae bacterium]
MTEQICTEFVELKKYLLERFSFKIQQKDLYRVRLFGKRGYYDESGDKTYLCYLPKACAYLLQLLKSAKGSRIKLYFDDDIDTDDSIMYETECYGRRKVSFKVDDKKLYW